MPLGRFVVKVRQGWPTGLAPFGYINVNDRDEPIQPHPEKARTVVRIFELYATGNTTFEALAKQLAAEGHTYRRSQPRFHRCALSYILNNRFYVGEIRHRGQSFPGKHKPFIDRATFDACQQVLQGKNRRTGDPQHALAGGLFRCGYCGQAITGERVRRKLGNGEVREHLYYRCANNHPGADHPRVRWKPDDLERAIQEDLARLKIPSPDIAAWLRTALAAAFADITATQHQQSASLAKRESELKAMQDRLLNAYLSPRSTSQRSRPRAPSCAMRRHACLRRRDALGSDRFCADEALCALRLESKRRGRLAPFKQWRPTRNPGFGLFEPHFDGRKSRR